MQRLNNVKISQGCGIHKMTAADCWRCCLVQKCCNVLFEDVNKLDESVAVAEAEDKVAPQTDSTVGHDSDAAKVEEPTTSAENPPEEPADPLKQELNENKEAKQGIRIY